MNERIRTGILAILCILLFIACRTVPVAFDTTATELKSIEVMKTQAEIVSASKDVTATIDDIKEITDTAKTTGTLTAEKIVKVIEYVDKSSSQVKSLNDTIARQTFQISTLEKSCIEDRSNASKIVSEKQAEVDMAKIKASIFFRWALITTVIALVLAGILWLPKLIKLII